MFARVRSSLGLAAILLMAGCGPAGPEKVDVEGTLSFDGVPVDDGAIQLIPVVSGPVQPIMVRKGKFQAKGDNAVLCGEYQVVFHSWETIMPNDAVMEEMEGEDGTVIPHSWTTLMPNDAVMKEMEGEDGTVIPEMMQRLELLPKKYSTEESREKLSLKPGTGSVTLTFDLKS